MERSGYLLSLPERFLRAAAAAVGGLIYETSQVLLPHWVRRSRLYKALVARLLQIMIEVIGDVQGVLADSEIASDELIARKTVGNVIEVAGFLALGWSPLWLLAGAADLTGGTQAYLRALVAELKRAGLLQPDTQIASTGELLRALEAASTAMADLVDVPPLNIPAMKASLKALREDVSALPDPERLAAIYNELKRVAQKEGRSPGAVSGILALSAARAGIELGQIHIFDYYRASLKAIQQEGFAVYTLRVSRPYLRAAIGHFNDQRSTRTERLWAALRQVEPVQRAHRSGE